MAGVALVFSLITSAAVTEVAGTTAGAALNVVGQLSLREPDLATQGVLCSLAALEGADNQLLGASLKTTEVDLNLTVDSLAVMASVQGVMANIAGPFWGVMADRGIMRQKDLMIIAALGQGFVTILLALTQSYSLYMVILRGLNGLFLAGLRPIANGMIAKTTSMQLQGKLFSRVMAFVLMGTSLCSVVVTPLSPIPVELFGMQFNGWRPAWVAVGLVSVLVAFVTSVFMVEDAPKRDESGQSIFEAVREEMGIFFGFMRMPSMAILVIQGTFGSMPWTVMYMMTRYYQLCGTMDDFTVGLVVALNPISAVIGTIFGGWISDQIQRRVGTGHGRPLVAQLSVALGIPWMYMNYLGVAPEDGNAVIYIFLNFGFGFFANWAAAGCNWPILSNIVPEHHRSRVMAVQNALENSLAAILGPYLLSIASNILGFDLRKIEGDSDREMAVLLGTAMTWVICVPWLICFVFYSVLHYTVPRDLARLSLELGRDEEEEELNRSKTAMSNDYGGVARYLSKGTSGVHL